jgi:hypothetical protein
MGPLVRIVLIALAIEIVIFITTSSIPVNDPQLVKEYEEFSSQLVSGDYLSIVLGIFTNNLIVTGISFIPIIGPAFLGYTIYNTGLMLSAYSTAYNVPGGIVASILLVLPHGVLEFLAYSIAVTGGVYLIWRRDLITSFLILGLAVLDLFSAALIEAELISVKGLTIAPLLWIASAALIALVFYLLSKIQSYGEKRKKPKQESTFSGALPPLPPI